MKPSQIVIGEYYRHKDTPNYAWAKVIEILPPRKGINTTSSTIAKCEWTVDKNDKFGLIKHFKVSSLIQAR